MTRFDDIDDWAPKLSVVVEPLVAPETLAELRGCGAPYVEDACAILLAGLPRKAVIDAALDWVRTSVIAGYHGTRLTDVEMEAVLREGLLPLSGEQRSRRLSRALQSHPEWPKQSTKLASVVAEHSGQNGIAGSREGQVHLTLSKCGLTEGFNHYMVYGSEFDKHVAHTLLGDDGIQLLSLDGMSRVVEVGVPGSDALRGCHPFFSVEDVLRSSELPNLVKEFLQAWSFRQAHPTFQCATMLVDCGMLFRTGVPSSWITAFETVPTPELR